MTESTTPPDHESTDGQGQNGVDGATSAAERPAAEADPIAALAELTNRYTRLAADFDNFRKRTAREAAERARFGGEAAARALLPVLDNLRRAVEHAPADVPEGLLEGLRATVRQFDDAMSSIGVEAIEAAGRPFDPALHEAVTAEDSDDVEVDTVVDELQRGYRLHDRVLRPTMVRIARATNPAAVPASERTSGGGDDGAAGWVEA